jgi:Terpene cyclase DEP1
MTEPLFKAIIIAAAAIFTALFAYWCIPPMIENPDLIGAFAAGFVNPYSSGYAADTLACWVILTAWIAYEARTKGLRHGWIFVLLGIIPGVAVGFAGYLLLRASQYGDRSNGKGQGGEEQSL